MKYKQFSSSRSNQQAGAPDWKRAWRDGRENKVKLHYYRWVCLCGGCCFVVKEIVTMKATLIRNTEEMIKMKVTLFRNTKEIVKMKGTLIRNSKAEDNPGQEW